MHAGQTEGRSSHGVEVGKQKVGSRYLKRRCQAGIVLRWAQNRLEQRHRSPASPDPRPGQLFFPVTPQPSFMVLFTVCKCTFGRSFDCKLSEGRTSSIYPQLRARQAEVVPRLAEQTAGAGSVPAL